MDSNPNDNFINEDLVCESSRAYFEHVKEQVLCSMCSNLFNDPKMCSECEVSFCSPCINNWLKKKNECPSRCSGKPNFKEVNKTTKRLLEGIKLKCPHDCEVPLLDYNRHVPACILAHKKVVCFNCNQQASHSDLRFKSLEEINFLRDTISKLESNEHTHLQKIELLSKKVSELEQVISNQRSQGSSKAVSSLIRQARILESTIVSADDEKYLREWVPNVFNFTNFKLIYRASRDGHTSFNFHDKCDKQGPTLIIMRTNFQKIIGGFTPISWFSPVGSGRFCKDETGRTFLFSLTLKEKYPLKNDTKYAICCNRNYGPIFGNYDLLLVTNSNINNIGNYDIGECYDYNGSKNDFYGGTPFKVTDYEVFAIPS